MDFDSVDSISNSSARRVPELGAPVFHETNAALAA
jgi:hypothetical protein